MIKDNEAIESMKQWATSLDDATDIELEKIAAYVGRVAKMRREEYGFSQSVVAGLLCTHQGRLAEIEAGLHKLTLRSLVRLSNILNLRLKITLEPKQ